ncbi:MAG TPA: hypothetical protein VG759_24115 [Candidatus Angelobacter sp.]|jgi:hypothetical protein|nr:hypothetical protein [Candidatus Angelobacter sp.]
MLVMNLWLIAGFLIGSFGFSSQPQSPPKDAEYLQRLRHTILQSRHLGAHGFGYNDKSLKTLSEKLTPGDIPGLINLLTDKDLRIGIQFALASQCEAAILPVREAVVQRKMLSLDGEDTMYLIESFAVCSPETRKKAALMRSEIESISQLEMERLEKQAGADHKNNSLITNS